LSWVEHVVEEYYKMKGYMISRRVKYKTPKPNGKMSNWKDIDILAVNEDEVLVVECKSFLGVLRGEKEEEIRL